MVKKKIESILVRAGLEPDGRRFTPHISIARLKDVPISKVANFLTTNSLFHTDPIVVEEIKLMSSQLGSAGASYKIEEIYSLQKEKETEQ